MNIWKTTMISLLCGLNLQALGGSPAFAQSEPVLVNGALESNGSTVNAWKVTGQIVNFDGKTLGHYIRLVKSGTSIRQTVATVPGQLYRLKFALIRSDNGPYLQIEVRVDNKPHYFEPKKDRGNTGALEFKATRAETEIVFAAPRTDGEHGPYVGRVRLEHLEESTLFKQSLAREYADYSDWVQRGQFDKLTKFYASDFSGVNSKQEAQDAAAAIADVGPVKNTRKVTVRFQIMEAKEEGGDAVISVERHIAFEEKSDDTTHRHTIVSQMTDIWTGGKDKWKLKKSVEISRVHEVDGETVK